MERVRCSYCKSDDVKYDSTTDMYYCRACSRLLGEDEVIKEKVVEAKPAPKPTQVSRQPEDLNTLSLLFLNVALWIPVLNVLTVFAINNSEVKEEYKREFSSKLVTDLFILAALVLVCTLYIYNGKIQIKDRFHYISDKLITSIVALNEGELSIPEFDSIDVIQLIEDSYVEEEVEEEEVVTVYSSEWSYLDGMTASGSKAVELLTAVDEQVIILVQTEQIRSKYQKTTYRNVGYLMEGSELIGTTGNYFYEGSLKSPVSLMVDDYGELTYIKTSDIYNKKYVYYLNPSYTYIVHVLQFEDNALAGFAFEEVSSK